ncbi:MAG: copper chaperone PCu(A)C [Gammaproteobacteria bacterium]|nr:copper chaperone PCu(A)C [Gammaproteobacteria bacterium]NIR82300.1 copper chaperone PCu(A)C [Gammaproteobacteria bacterium]NIR91231.1 copper chaperone PCu(A)C [Gammaproteobacteria bacterium]NIU03449.1 copper chaperone PCu(A)C [Gammaproteobacteria bacterium]NIX84724.1 copper chaperone PCu(A)C [Gammaproteobacteria bacterium]
MVVKRALPLGVLLAVLSQSVLAEQPGGYHIMLMHPHEPLVPGDTVSLRLRFQDLPDLALEAPVRSQR